MYLSPDPATRPPSLKIEHGDGRAQLTQAFKSTAFKYPMICTGKTFCKRDVRVGTALLTTRYMPRVITRLKLLPTFNNVLDP